MLPDLVVVGLVASLALAMLAVGSWRRREILATNLLSDPRARWAFLFVGLTLFSRLTFLDENFVPRYGLCLLTPSVAAIALSVGASRAAQRWLQLSLVGWLIWNSVNAHGGLYPSLNSLPRGPLDGDYVERDGSWLARQDALLALGRLLDVYDPSDVLLLPDSQFAHVLTLPEMGYVQHRFQGYCPLFQTAFVPWFRDDAEIPLPPPSLSLIVITQHEGVGRQEELIFDSQQASLRAYLVSDPVRIESVLRDRARLAHAFRFQRAADWMRAGQPDRAASWVHYLVDKNPGITEPSIMNLLESDWQAAQGHEAEAAELLDRVATSCPALAEFHPPLRERLAKIGQRH